MSRNSPPSLLCTQLSAARARENPKKQKEQLTSIIHENMKKGRLETFITQTYEDPSVLKILKDPCLEEYWRRKLEQNDLQRHRFNEQTASLPDLRHPCELLLGVLCFGKSRQPAAKIEVLRWLTHGEYFGDYHCIEALNVTDRHIIDGAAERKKLLTTALVMKILTRAHRAANLHGAVGYGLLAQTLFQLGRYFHKHLLFERGTHCVLEDRINIPSHCHQFFTPLPLSEVRLLYQNTLLVPSESVPSDFLVKRDRCYLEAIKLMTVAIHLEGHCAAILHNIAPNFSESMVNCCSWVYRGAKNLRDIRRVYTLFLDAANLGVFVESAIREGGDVARRLTDLEAQESRLGTS